MFVWGCHCQKRIPLLLLQNGAHDTRKILVVIPPNSQRWFAFLRVVESVGQVCHPETFAIWVVAPKESALAACRKKSQQNMHFLSICRARCCFKQLLENLAQHHSRSCGFELQHFPSSSTPRSCNLVFQ